MRVLSLGATVLALVGGGACHRPNEPTADWAGWYVRQPGFANARPALVGDLVISGTGDGQIIARKRRTGDVIWATRVATGRIRGANLAAAGGVVIAPVATRTVALDAATGAVLWTYSAPADTVDGGPKDPGLVAGVFVDADTTAAYIPAWGGTIAAVELRSGGVLWMWRPEASTAHRLGAEGVRLEGGVAFATVWHFLNSTGTQCEGWIVALDKHSGRELWRTILPARSTAVCLPGRPAVSANRVTAVLLTGELYALDRETGRVVWTKPRDDPGPNGFFNAVITGCVVADDVVYADAGTGALLAYRASDGRPVWRSPYLGQFKHEPVVIGRHILVPDGMRLLVFDRASGRWIRTLTQPGETTNSLFAASLAADSTLVYAPVNGGLWAFRP